jgi:radical SAM protein with 4Fe4S-binding SPASM domain
MDKDLREHSLKLFKNNEAAPTLILIRVSKTCNAKCKMCDFWKNPDKGHNFKKFIKLIKSAKKLGGKRIRLTGGEPTIWPHFFDALRLIKNEGMEPAFITNGLTLDEKKCNEILSIGVKQITFSINSSSPKNHDYLIGIDGAWDKTFNALKIISTSRKAKLNPKLTVNFILTKDNYSDLEKLIDKNDGTLFDEINLIPIKKISNLQMDPKKIIEYNQSVGRIKDKAKKIGLTFTTDTPYVFGINQNQIDDSSKGEYASDFYIKNKCYAVNYMLFIDSEGNVFPCNNTPYAKEKFCIGNINDQDLEDIWFSKKAQEIRLIAGKEKICQGCDYKNKVFNKLANEINHDTLSKTSN